jgi:nitrite reductase/ring-hydroxylating ferredoxin subunit
MSALRIAEENQIKEGESVKFEFQRAGKKLQGFLARYKNQLVAYENVCRHIPISLDYGDDRFFNRAKSHFICQSHGAIYDPLSGVCVGGPCTGETLKRLKIEVRGGAVWLVD